MARVARDYLAIQGSSVASERKFSSAKMTDDYLRNRLSTWHFGQLQVLKDRFLDDRTKVSVAEKAAVTLHEAQKAQWLVDEALAALERAREAGVSVVHVYDVDTEVE